jgi:ABC-type multidrug transport system fused ATPase/permease subunit
MGWLERNIIEPGKLPLLLALVSFVLTFLITRGITRLIRAGKGPFRNVSGSGGVHIHHVVPGVILTIIGGFGAVAGGQYGFGSALSAVVFGIGAGLVLDEFALVLHLADVYWTEAGRKSVEMVVLTASLVGLLLIGFSPLGVNDLSDDQEQNRATVIVNIVVNFVFALIALFKGRTRLAVFGVIVPVMALIGAVRLARPGSYWAKRFYRRRPRARAKSSLRAYRHDRRWIGPRRAFQDWIGGAPDPQPARSLEHR